MWQATKRIDEHLDAAPRRCSGREVEHLLSVHGAKTSIDVGFLRELLLEEPNAKPPEGALQHFDLAREVHPLRVDSGPDRRNLVQMAPELIGYDRFDSVSKTLDRRG